MYIMCQTMGIFKMGGLVFFLAIRMSATWKTPICPIIRCVRLKKKVKTLQVIEAR